MAPEILRSLALCGAWRVKSGRPQECPSLRRSEADRRQYKASACPASLHGCMIRRQWPSEPVVSTGLTRSHDASRSCGTSAVQRNEVDVADAKKRVISIRRRIGPGGPSGLQIRRGSQDGSWWVRLLPPPPIHLFYILIFKVLSRLTLFVPTLAPTESQPLKSAKNSEPGLIPLTIRRSRERVRAT